MFMQGIAAPLLCPGSSLLIVRASLHRYPNQGLRKAMAWHTLAPHSHLALPLTARLPAPAPAKYRAPSHLLAAAPDWLTKGINLTTSALSA